jgi:DNA-binding SARP family transcriptional activator/tetratricopeptide (TPR) repeat protein
MQSRLLLRQTGRFEPVGGPGADLEPKDALLLAYLVIEGPTPRGRLATLIWPDVDGERARANLRQRLLRLKRTLGVELVAGGAVASLAPDVAHDLDGAIELLQAIQWVPEGELLGWLESQRERRRQVGVGDLSDAADQAEAKGEFDTALKLAREVLARDSLSEHAHRRVIRLHYLRGDRASALLAFDQCEALLKSELGAKPGSETIDLLRTVEQAKSVPARLVRSLAPTVVRPPRMIGRHRELAALSEAVRRGMHVAVVGHAGMGKTRLLWEFSQGLSSVVQVAARPGDAGTPFALLARLVRALLGARRAIPEGLRAELARFVPELGEAARTSFDAGAFEHVVEALFTDIAESGPHLIFDDLHFSDQATVDLLARTALSATVPALTFGIRPDDGAAALATLQIALGETQRYEQIDLSPLIASELHELVDSLGIPGLAGAALAVPLLHHCGGNPQFVLETLRALLLDNEATAFQSDRLPLPAGVGGLIERRLKRLSPVAVKLARVAAIAAADFDAPLAAKVMGVDVLDLADPWRELEAAHVFADDAFAHDLVYESVRSGVPRAIARHLHAGIAAVLEERGAAPGAIAEHWLAAGDLDRAVTPLQLAAASAENASRVREAAQLYGRLARVQTSRGDHYACLRALQSRFDLLFHCATGEEIDEALEELHRLSRSDFDLARAFESQGRLGLARNDFEAAQDAARKAIEFAQRAADKSVECDARMTLAQVMLRKRLPDEAAAVLASVRDWAQKEAPLEQRYLFEQCSAWLAQESERYGQALQEFTRCAEVAVAQGSMSNLAIAMSYQVMSLGYRGAFSEAANVGDRLRSLMLEYRLFGDPFPTIDSNLSHVCIYAGRYADALAAIERGELQQHAHMATLALRRGVLYFALGQPGRARPLVERSLEQTQVQALRLPPLLVLARILHAITADAASASRIEALLTEAERTASDSPKVSPKARCAVVRAECGEGESRLAAARHAVQLLEGRETFGLRIAAHARLAQALHETGRLDEAMDAVDAFLTLGESFEPELMFRGEAALIAYRVLDACGSRRANDVLRGAVGWIHKAAADQVPVEFRDGFLNRERSHRELLTIATRVLCDDGARRVPPAVSSSAARKS